jgi:hypothetical protein
MMSYQSNIHKNEHNESTTLTKEPQISVAHEKLNCPAASLMKSNYVPKLYGRKTSSEIISTRNKLGSEITP